MGLITLTEKLRKPDREYTAFPFWFFNGDFTDEEIIRQIRDFRDKGIYGFVLHPRMGIPESIPYLSDAFMHYVKTAVETAHEEGMQVVLYDEGMYPSGSAHGMIAAADPALASVGLTLEEDWKGKGGCPAGKRQISGMQAQPGYDTGHSFRGGRRGAGGAFKRRYSEPESGGFVPEVHP